MTDVHEINQVSAISEVVDVIQLPAFLARQTDLIEAIARTGLVINVKKPQYMDPAQIKFIVNKFHFFKNYNIILCERGTMFGYNNLVVDMLGLKIMNSISGGCPVIVDVTHSLQTRSSLSSISGGRGSQVFTLSRASTAIGIAGLFVESHPNPDQAKCDGYSALSLNKLESLLNQVKAIDEVVKSF